MGRRNDGHDRGVDNTETIHTIYLQVGVHNPPRFLGIMAAVQQGCSMVGVEAPLMCVVTFTPGENSKAPSAAHDGIVRSLRQDLKISKATSISTGFVYTPNSTTRSANGSVELIKTEPRENGFRTTRAIAGLDPLG
jgi:hypothetical protein